VQNSQLTNSKRQTIPNRLSLKLNLHPPEAAAKLIRIQYVFFTYLEQLPLYNGKMVLKAGFLRPKPLFSHKFW
jgi:hypothetical protein